jgi:hypothetical protein
LGGLARTADFFDQSACRQQCVAEFSLGSIPDIKVDAFRKLSQTWHLVTAFKQRLGNIIARITDLEAQRKGGQNIEAAMHAPQDYGASVDDPQQDRRRKL